MYNKTYYAYVDYLMKKVLKACCKQILTTLYVLAMYLCLQPVRLYQYLKMCYMEERKEELECDRRFEEMMRKVDEMKRTNNW